MDLPSAEELYATFLAPWHPDAATTPPVLRSDLEEIELPPGTPIHVLNPLPRETRGQVLSQIRRMDEAAHRDLGEGEDWLARFEADFGPDRVRALLRQSPPDQLSNSYLLLCCECGARLGMELQKQVPRLQWLPDLPYWESALFDLNRRLRIPVFHWAVRFLSADADQSLCAKRDATIALLLGT